MSRRNVVGVALCCIACSGLVAEFAIQVVRAADQEVSFNRDIRPILSDNCLSCHGQDANTREADLRLDTFEGATADLWGTQAVVPGDLEKSQLWIRVTSESEYEVMPPPASHKQLSDAQKTLLKQWILEGARYENHWAFEPIRRPDVPQIQDAAHPIDALLAAARQAADLPVQPLADRETLIRRVAFALTGLPPTIDQIDAYLADHSPQAYEHMVDRYLDSPHYGQEMARHWLDVARYADTHGCTWTTSVRCGRIAIGWSKRSTRICRSTSSRSGRSRATSCPNRRPSSWLPPVSTAATSRPAKAERSTRNSRTATRSNGRVPWLRRGWD
jgi:hypothetical protein